MLTVDYDGDQELDVAFSKVQFEAAMGMFGADWDLKHICKRVSSEQQPVTNIWKLAEWRLRLAHNVSEANGEGRLLRLGLIDL